MLLSTLRRASSLHSSGPCSLVRWMQCWYILTHAAKKWTLTRYSTSSRMHRWRAALICSWRCAAEESRAGLLAHRCDGWGIQTWLGVWKLSPDLWDRPLELSMFIQIVVCECASSDHTVTDYCVRISNTRDACHCCIWKILSGPFWKVS